MADSSHFSTAVIGGLPTLLRRQVDRGADAWLTTKFSRLLELRAQDPGPFNYPIAVFSEWRGKAFDLNVRYRTSIGMSQSTTDTSSSSSRAGLPMTSISVILPFAIVNRSALTSLPRGATTTPMAPFTSAGCVSRARCP